MWMTIQLQRHELAVDFAAGRSIAIPMAFGGPQPNLFGVPAAQAKTVEAGSFLGDTRRGGAVNVEAFSLIPHCNGTHTECLGHLTDPRFAVADVLDGAPVPALLLSVRPEAAAGTPDTYHAAAAADDRQITAASLRRAAEEATAGLPADLAAPGGPLFRGLVLRSLPNPPSKCHARYGSEPPMPPYFTREAMTLVAAWGVQHLVVDLPSVDRPADAGRLLAHRLFWNLPAEGHAPGTAPRQAATITELVYVADDLGDGAYLLNLAVPPFRSDAAPSNVWLYPLHATAS